MIPRWEMRGKSEVDQETAHRKKNRSEDRPLQRQERNTGLSVVDQAEEDDVKSELEAVRNAEFVEDVVQVIFYGLLGDKKLFTDLFVAEALRDELNDFLFAVGEQRLFAARPGFRRLRERLHDFGGHAIIE